jgi:signal recognition particle GTPase
MDDIPCYVSILKAMSEKERNDDLLTDDDRVEELAAITGTTSSRVHQLLAELRQAKSMCGRIGQFLSSAQSGVWPP